jgi:hypothetical protein
MLPRLHACLGLILIVRICGANVFSTKLFISEPRVTWPQQEQMEAARRKGSRLLTTGGIADVERPDFKLERLAFGSCSMPMSPQRLWSPVREKSPQMWLWAGDSVYVTGDNPPNLRLAFQVQLQQPGYDALLSEDIIVDGVYDDHDYGGNDAGKTTVWKFDSQQLFLDFIGVPVDSPRRTRQGVYTSYLFGANPREMVRVILLDTRFHRDNHIIPSFAAFGIRLPWLGFKFIEPPLGSFVAATIRYAYQHVTLHTCLVRMRGSLQAQAVTLLRAALTTRTDTGQMAICEHGLRERVFGRHIGRRTMAVA